MIVALGDIVVDVVVTLREELQRGSDVSGDIELLPGGSAANFASWAVHLGARTTFIGKVGDDFLGRFLLEDLSRCGVCSRVVVSKRHKTGRILVVVDPTGERSMVVGRGASLALEPEEVDHEAVARARLLHLTGYSFFSDTTRWAARRAMAVARDNGVWISFDPSSFHPIRDFGPRQLLEEMRGVAFLFPNLEEGRVLTGETEPEAVVERLSGYARTVILKLGAGGCIVRGPGGTVRIPGREVRVVDTTGAGDAFAAAFIVKFLETRDERLAGEFAVSVSARVVQYVGARPRRGG